MPIFLDSANVNEIERFHRMGIIRGVTTNPTIFLKDGLTGGMTAIEARARLQSSLLPSLYRWRLRATTASRLCGRLKPW